MLAIAWQTVRGRWVSFAGMFVALFLSVGLLTVVALSMAATFMVPAPAPERFATAPAVVYPSDVLRVETSEGPHTARLEHATSLSPQTVSRVQALGRTVADRTVFAQMATAADTQVGRTWSSAVFGPYALLAGREPQADHEVVVSEGQANLHESVRILTSKGVGTYTVSGLTRAVDVESPIFFADAEAAHLSSSVSALVSFAEPEVIRQAVGEDARVLTGAERYLADPDPHRNQKALNDTQIILGIAGGFTAFVAIFVVASTFAFVTAQRQREFALLRTIGALPVQVRRMVLFETALLGLTASLCGSGAGALSTPFFTDWLIHLGVAPAWFGAPVTLLPVVLACVAGLSVALLGTVTASLRASKAQPLAALRAAALDEQGMTKTRWVWAWSCLAVGLIVMTWIAFKQPRLAIIPQIYLGALMLPVVASALFAPAVVPSLVKLIMWPLRHVRSAAGMIARQSALTAIRRTVATAVPVLLIVGLFVSLLGATSTITAARSAELTNSIKADYVVVPDPAAALSSQTIEQVQAVPNVAALATTPITAFALDDDELRTYDAEAVDPGLLTTMLDVPLVAGSLADLRDDTIVVNENWEKEVGQRVDVWFADGTKKIFTVAAIIKTRINPMDAYVTPAHAGNAQADIMYVKAKTPDALAALRTATQDQSVKVVPVAEWTGAAGEGNVRASHIGMVVTLGIVGVYSAIALVNTLVISSAGRLRDVATLRLAGATRGQIYWFVVAESLLVVAIGTILAIVAFTLNSAAHHVAIDRLVASAPTVIPWAAMGITIGMCAMLAIVASVLPVAFALRKGTPKV